ncbi:MAG: Rieske 2Fe-2S domain-containing protein [Chloroflexota bacterium]|nr:Rieske 2Fe-2S domain-containing protein [Chloroflexota bacterium]
MTTKTYKRSLFQRLLGKPMTKPPVDAGCWSYDAGKLTIDLNRTPELTEPWGATHIDGENLPDKVLVFQDGEGNYRAFQNRCEHGGRKIDPVPGTETVKCCSMGQATYDYEGNVLSGASENPIKCYEVQLEDGKLIVMI